MKTLMMIAMLAVIVAIGCSNSAPIDDDGSFYAPEGKHLLCWGVEDGVETWVAGPWQATAARDDVRCVVKDTEREVEEEKTKMLDKMAERLP